MVAKSSPYKGLMPYDEADAAFFFGRTQEIRLITANLFAAPATVLIGASGVGKSSILRAGVVSALRNRTDVLPVIHSMWRDDPVNGLERAVTRAVDESLGGPTAARERIPDEIADVVSKYAAPVPLADRMRFQSRRAGRHVMVILDQFEEFFLYNPGSPPFLEDISDAVNSSALNPRAAIVEPTFDDDQGSADAGSTTAYGLRASIGRVLYGLNDADREVALAVIDFLSANGVRATVAQGTIARVVGAPGPSIDSICARLEQAGVVRRHVVAESDVVELSDDVMAQQWLRLRSGRSAVAESIAAWLTSAAPAPVSYLFSLREDALAKLDLFEGRVPDLMDRLLRIENLTREGGREAITRPLEVYNERSEGARVSIEPQLVEKVLRQVARGRINVNEYALGRPGEGADSAGVIDTAFLQLVMTRLWDEERRLRSSVLRADTLDKLEGAENIVRTHLDHVMAELDEADRRTASQVFRYLITPSGTKVAHSARDLASYTESDEIAVDRLLTALSSGSDRILRPIQPSPERPDVPRYEIFHDRLGQAILGWLSRFGASEAANEAARKATIAASSPLSRVEVEASSPEDTHTSGLSLCFTGGGFRAMLFHVGALWRLNEVGLLSTAAQISSVSAGSLVAAKLGAVWGDLGFDANGIAARFEAALVAPLRALAEKTIDVRSALAGTLLPFTTPADRFVHELERHLLGRATLAELPERPRILLVASNMQDGTLWRFSRAYMGDQRTGAIRDPDIRLSTAVAASAAAPPVLSPLILRVSRPAGNVDEPSKEEDVFLTDGAVLDRLSIETAWRRYRDVLVSDGSGKLTTEETPATDWARQSRRVIELIDWQARSAQKRQLIDSFATGVRNGAYWGISSTIDNFNAASTLPCPSDRTRELADLPARFAKLDETMQQRLINWGYAICDAAVRQHYLPDASPPAGFPYPDVAI